MEISIRKLKASDIDFVYAVANDPLTRAMSINSSEIPYERHQSWFAKRLIDSEVFHFIVETADGVPVGQVMLTNGAEVNIGIHPAYRGQGYAKPALQKIVTFAYDELQFTHCLAKIKPENLASTKVFLAVGFKLEGEEEIKGVKVISLKHEGLTGLRPSTPSDQKQ